MKEVKRCSGHKSHWECAEEYPDHQVPVGEFGPYRDGLQAMCQKCKKYCDGIRSAIRDPIMRAVLEFAKSEGIVINRKEWRALPRAYRDEVAQRWHEECSKLSNVIPFNSPPEFTNSYEEVTTVNKGRKRDQKVVTYIKNSYSSCAVDGCEYSLFDVAHVHALKHGADDLPGNCIPLCPNHHRDLDRGLLRLSEPNRRSASEPIEFELNGVGGKIILSDPHKVDNKYVKGCINEIGKYLKDKGVADENAISKS